MFIIKYYKIYYKLIYIMIKNNKNKKKKEIMKLLDENEDKIENV